MADPTPPVERYEPGHPDADSRGYVSYPDINPIEEMVNLRRPTCSSVIHCFRPASEKTSSAPSTKSATLPSDENTSELPPTVSIRSC